MRQHTTDILSLLTQPHDTCTVYGDTGLIQLYYVYQTPLKLALTYYSHFKIPNFQTRNSLRKYRNRSNNKEQRTEKKVPMRYQILNSKESNSVELKYTDMDGSVDFLSSKHIRPNLNPLTKTLLCLEGIFFTGENLCLIDPKSFLAG